MGGVLQKAVPIAAALALLFSSSRAHAYRPFDGTDAAVAELHEFELELGPVGYASQGPDHLLVVPRYVLNYGIADRVELVVDGRGLLPLDGHPTTGTRAYRYDENDVFLKTVFRRALDVAGPSRLLFGTDSSFFPRGWNYGVLDAQIRALKEAGAGEADARQILGGNLLFVGQAILPAAGF